jgi:hypothetical protein
MMQPACSVCTSILMYVDPLRQCGKKSLLACPPSSISNDVLTRLSAGFFQHELAVALFRLSRRAVISASVVITPVIAATVVTIPSTLFALAPATAAQLPSIASLAPFRPIVLIACARSFPMPAGPDVPAAVPVPITRRPQVSDAWRRHAFIPWRRRRCSNRDIDADLRHCLAWHKSCSTQCYECSRTEDTFHIFLTWLSSIANYIVNFLGNNH